MTLYDYLRILHNRWRVVFATVIAALLVASAAFVIIPARHSATTRILFGVRGNTDPGQLTRSITYTTAVVQSYARLVQLPVVLDPVIDELGLDTDAESLAGKITGTAQKNSLILRISATDGDRQRAAALANAVGAQLVTLVERLGNTSATAVPSTSSARKDPPKFTASTISSASAGGATVFPRPRPMFALALAIGVLGGLLLAIAVGVRDRRIMDRYSLIGATDLQVVGSIAAHGESRGRLRGRTGRGPRGRAQETAATLLALTIRSRARVLAFTCAYEDEASVTVVAQLGDALSRLGHRVLLVDADVRSPQLAVAVEGVSAPPVGLTDVLARRVNWADAVRQTRPGGPSLLAAGTAEPGPDPLVSPIFPRVLAEAAKAYDLVLVKSPPALRAADGLLVSGLVDQVVIVADGAGMSQRSLLELSGSLALVGARPMGLILSA